MNIEKLINDCRKKDRAAQRELVDWLAPTLMSVSRRYAKSTADAKDILQESLIRIFNHIDQFRSDAAAFRSWCIRITINQALARYRYQKTVVNMQDYFQPTQQPAGLEKLLAEDILRLLDRLPPLSRQVFNLHCIDGYRHQEIAKLLDIEVSHSRTILTRARKQLQQFIQTTKNIAL